MLSFHLWLEGRSATRGKIGLYPPLYTQYLNYCPQDVITWSADSFTYMNPADIQFQAFDGKFKPYVWKDSKNQTKTG